MPQVIAACPLRPKTYSSVAHPAPVSQVMVAGPLRLQPRPNTYSSVGGVPADDDRYPTSSCSCSLVRLSEATSCCSAALSCIRDFTCMGDGGWGHQCKTKARSKAPRPGQQSYSSAMVDHMSATQSAVHDTVKTGGSVMGDCKAMQSNRNTLDQKDRMY